MDFTFRPADRQDEAFLWEMLYRAAHMDEDNAGSRADASQDPDLRRYVEGWGRESDIGVVALAHGRPIGVWARLLVGANQTIAYIDDDTPEVAIAVTPEYARHGIGSALLARLITIARDRYCALSLSVRADNPAKRLYDRFGFRVVREAVNRIGGRSFVMALTLRDGRL